MPGRDIFGVPQWPWIQGAINLPQEPREVWVLVWEGDHETSDVYGVYSTPELGMDAPGGLTRDGKRREAWKLDRDGINWECNINGTARLMLYRHTLDDIS